MEYLYFTRSTNASLIKYFLSLAFTISIFNVSAQTDGISYQAVILSKDSGELPGYDSQNDILALARVAFEFTITGQNNIELYRETQIANTDKNGLVNLIIGQGDAIVGDFNSIEWNGQKRILEVKIDVNAGTNFLPLDAQELLFLPFALHRNIIASGNLNIAGTSNFEQQVDIESDLMVLGNTSLSENISIDGNTAISGQLTVDGGTILNLNTSSDKNSTNSLLVNGSSALDGTLTVMGESVFNKSLSVLNESQVYMSGSLTTDGLTQLNNRLIVLGSTMLENSLTVSDTSTFNSYVEINAPADINDRLFVKGSSIFMDHLDVVGTTNLASTLRVENGSPTFMTGTLIVDGITDLNNDLIVDGTSTLNSALTVTNNSGTNLTGTLSVDGITDLSNNLILDGTATMNSSLQVTGSSVLNSTLAVAGATQLNNTLNVSNNTSLGGTLTTNGATQLNSSLSVSDNTSLSGTLEVANTANFRNQVTVNVGLGSGSSSYNNYPLRVQGSANGIAVKITAGTPNNDNNFITFFDSGGTARGAIEGETTSEKVLNPEYLYDLGVLTADVAAAAANVGFAAIPTVVAGLGASAGPCASCIATAAAEVIVAAAHMAAFLTFSLSGVGVTYSSGSADYAEWLDRLNPNEQINSGDVVGVYNGKVTKIITNEAQRVLVVSTNPAILGNTPEYGNTDNFEKIAFLGQVPVKVKDEVISGDYLIPSGDNLGYAIGISKDEIQPNQFKHIIGIAWSSSIINQYDYVKMAIGLNSNDLADLVSSQQTQINALDRRLKAIENNLASNDNDTLQREASKPPLIKEENTIAIQEFAPAYLSDDTIQEALLIVIEQFPEGGNNPDFIEKLFVDNKFKQEIINKVKTIYREQYLKK